MLGKKEQAKAFMVVAVIYGTWHAVNDWTRLFLPYLHMDAHMNMFHTGLLTTIGNAFMLLGTFVVGHLMDTNGAKFAGIITALISGLFYIIDSQITSFLAYVAIQPIKMGLCLNQVVEAYLASTTDEKERTKVIMRLGIPFGFAAIVGPLLALTTLDLDFGFRGSAACAGVVLLIVSLPLLFFGLPESEQLPKSKRPSMIRLSEYKEMLQSKPLQMTLLVKFLLDGPYQAFDAPTRRFMVGLVLASSQEVVGFFVIVGIATIFSNTILIQFLQKRFRPQQVLQIGLLSLTVAYVVISFIPRNSNYFLAIMLVHVIGYQLAYSELLAQIVNSVDRQHCGKAVGLGYAVQLLAATITSVIAGYFVVQYNYSVWCYASAGISLIGFLILPFVGGYMNQQMDRLPSVTKNY